MPKYAKDDIVRSGHIEYDTLYASNEREVLYAAAPYGSQVGVAALSRPPITSKQIFCNSQSQTSKSFVAANHKPANYL